MIINKVNRLNDERSLVPKMLESSKIAAQFDAFLLQGIVKNETVSQHFTDKSNVFINQNNNQYSSIFSNKLINKSVSHATLPIDSSEPPATTWPPITVIDSDQTETSNNSYATSADFIKTIWPIAQQAAQLIGLDPKLLVAQAALETGWGRFIANDTSGESSHNLFNIKAPANNPEQAVYSKTTEFIANMPIKTTAAFKKYSSIMASFSDYIHLIATNPRYQDALASVSEPQRYVAALQTAGYATDPTYADKLLAIYHGALLQQALS